VKNIIHITTFLQGGAGKIICELAEAQIKSGHTVTCILNEISYPNYFTYPEYERFLNKIGVNLIKVSELFKRKESGIKKASILIEQQLRKSKVDLIHCHAAIPSYAALMAIDLVKLKIPIIQTMHGWGTNKTLAHERMDINILTNIDKIICVSNSSTKLLISKGIPAKNINTIYNGINDNKQLLSKKTNPLLNNIPDNAFIIACVGTLCDRKNQELLISSLIQLHTDKNLPIEKEVYCIFIGEDNSDYADKIKKIAKNSILRDRIKFLGCMQQIEYYLSLFDVLVLPSKAEGLPLSIIEAFRENVLVIASDIPECCELIQHEKSGLLFHSESHKSLASTLLMVMSLDKFKKKEIIKNAYLQFKLNFLQRKMLKSYEDLYQEVINSD